jgi:hypothetical protein
MNIGKGKDTRPDFFLQRDHFAFKSDQLPTTLLRLPSTGTVRLTLASWPIQR